MVELYSFVWIDVGRKLGVKHVIRVESKRITVQSRPISRTSSILGPRHRVLTPCWMSFVNCEVGYHSQMLEGHCVGCERNMVFKVTVLLLCSLPAYYILGGWK